jgi:hypothetical protein
VEEHEAAADPPVLRKADDPVAEPGLVSPRCGLIPDDEIVRSVGAAAIGQAVHGSILPLHDAGLSNTEAFAANAFFTVGQVLFEVPTGVPIAA